MAQQLYALPIPIQISMPPALFMPPPLTLTPIRRSAKARRSACDGLIPPSPFGAVGACARRRYNGRKYNGFLSVDGSDLQIYCTENEFPPALREGDRAAFVVEPHVLADGDVWRWDGHYRAVKVERIPPPASSPLGAAPGAVSSPLGAAPGAVSPAPGAVSPPPPPPPLDATPPPPLPDTERWRRPTVPKRTDPLPSEFLAASSPQ